MLEQISALLLLAAIFAIGTVRKVHIGILAFVAAAGVGVLIAGMKLKDVISGFPIGILILLAGVTFFFGIAHENGTIRRIIDRAIHQVGDRAALLPFVFFALACGIAAMGSSLASLALAPIGMPLAHRYRIDPVLMGLSIGTGLTAGAFAPTSLFGIITYGTASGAGIDLDPMVLFAVSLVANIVLLAVAFAMFGGLSLPRGSIPSATPASAGQAKR